MEEPTKFSADHSFEPPGGDVAALMDTVDWAQTPFGPREHWPQSLKTSVSICLNSSFGLVTLWGPELAFIYNNNYAMVLGDKHPSALGRAGRDIWPEVWPTIGPMLQQVLDEGRSTRSDDLLLMLERHGYPEECYFTFAYSAILDESGGIGGVFSAVIETTQKVVQERQLRTLRELADSGHQAADTSDVLRAVASVLDLNPWDIPFALMYGVSPQTGNAGLVCWTGDQPPPGLAPTAVHVGSHTDAQLTQAIALAAVSGQACEAALPVQSDLPLGAWQIGAQQALVLPIGGGGDKPAALLVCAVNPHRRLDADYRGFFDMLGREVSSVVTAVIAYSAERERARKLAEIDHAKTAFFTNVSHEFRTPLTLMLEPLSELATVGLTPAQQKLVDLAGRNAHRLLRLVNTLLDFSSIEASRGSARFVPTELGAYTADIASAFRSVAAHAGLRFVVDCAQLSQPVWIDRDLWEKVVLNLVSNAIKFTLHGEIAIRLHDVAGGVELDVHDTGVGITPQDQPRVFDRFFRAAQPQGRSIEGSGIGLALVRELVHMHGGSIALQSQPGIGSSFRVRLRYGHAHLPQEQLDAQAAPSSGEAATAFVDEARAWMPHDHMTARVAQHTTLRRGADSAGDASPATSTTGPPAPHVLVADDNADMRLALRHALAPRYRVQLVENGLQALEAIRRERPDLLLADVMMPELDGFGLLAAVRSDPDLAGLPVILVSARAGDEAREQGLEARADDYVVKPFRTRELLARIEQQLALTSLRRQLAERGHELLLRDERLRAAEALRDSEERFRQLTELSSDWYWEQDAHFCFTYLSDGVTRSFGLTPEQMLGRSRWGHETINVHDPQWARHKADLQALRAFRNVLLARPTDDGGKHWFVISGAPFFDASGVFKGYRGVGSTITERVRAEQGLQESEALLKTIFDHAPVGIALLKVSGQFVRSNRALEQLLGYDEAELRTMTVRDVTVGHDWMADEKLRARLLAGEMQRFVYRKRLWQSDGGAVWTSNTVTAVLDADGGVLYTVSLIADITAERKAQALRKRAQRALVSAERQQRGLAQQLARERTRLIEAQAVAKLGSWETHLVTLSVTWSEQMHRIFETDPISFEPDHPRFLDRVHQDDRSTVEAAFAASTSQPGEHVIEHRVVLPGGGLKHVEERWRVYGDDAGVPVRALGTTWDITQRRLADEERAALLIREQVARREADAASLYYRSLFEAAPGCYLVLEPRDFRIVAVSGAYLRATWTTRAQIMDQLLFDVFPDDPDDPQAVGVHNMRRSLERVKSSARADVMAVQRYPIRRPPAEGGGFEERFWSPVNSPVPGPAGGVAFIIHRIEDVTDYLDFHRRAGTLDDAHLALDTRQAQVEAEIVLRNAELRRSNEQLARSQALLQMASRLSRLGAWAYDMKVHAIDCSDDALAIAGLAPDRIPAPDEVVALPAPEYVLPARHAFRQCVNSGLSFDMELQIIDPRRQRVWVRVIGAAVRDESGRIAGLQGAVQDISQRVASNLALRESRDLLTHAQQITGLAYWEYDPRADRAQWSESLYAILGITPDATQWQLANVLGFIHPDDRQRIADLFERALVQGESWQEECHVLRPDGEQRVVLVRGEPTRDAGGEVARIVGSCLDVTEQRRAANELLALSRRLVKTQEAERRNIATELHDRVGQNLTALSINLEIMRGSAERGRFSELDPRFRASQALVDATSLVISDVMAELRPPMLDDYGLASALIWYAEQFERLNGIRVRVKIEDDMPAPTQSRDLALFRVAQEALNNVAKHAQVHEVHLSLAFVDGNVQFKVQDAGVGFDPADIRFGAARLGMRTMRERVTAVGGQLTVTAAQGQGVTIEAWVPQ